MLSVALTLAACATRETVTTTEAMCKPWRPFDYSSKTKTSARFAGKTLARDLAVHNETGRTLKCWE